ncbi:hypothetical protein NUW58_g5646 [Xylaria curta]|uniref:Uncharacterized protein n=1 Tax=Xylaria curta TaxID=42375 RepID=A0ACC1P0L4_9PEZI|nr:hypothetical protein NUW58_g5646 [Xylaria curta]
MLVLRGCVNLLKLSERFTRTIDNFSFSDTSVSFCLMQDGHYIPPKRLQGIVAMRITGAYARCATTAWAILHRLTPSAYWILYFWAPSDTLGHCRARFPPLRSEARGAIMKRDANHNQEAMPSYYLFLDVPFSKRWESHKNTIYRLYIDEDLSVEEVAGIMKCQYQFDASVRQYKYHFKKWEISKSIPSAVKDQAIRTLGKRVRDGTAFRGIKYKGVEIDKKRLRRYINDDVRLNSNFEMTASVFGRWNLPYRALKATSDHLSPGASDFPTPSDYSVLSPPAIRDHPTPSNAHSPADAPTPTVRAIQAKSHFDRSRLFVQGHIDEFLKGLPSSDKMVVTTWLHQFWIFAFTTTKYWGKGPQKWTADLLRMTDFPDRKSLPGSPAAWRGSEAPSPGDARNQYGARFAGHQRDVPRPSSLCRWCIHVREMSYQRLASPPPEEDINYDAQDPDNWPRWETEPCTVTDRLHDALQDNSFSSVNTQDLPLSTTVIATAAAGSPEAMAVEAIGFAIKARNADLLSDLIDTANTEDQDLSSIYPYHLAASYLDGSSICCGIIDQIMSLVRQNVIGRLYINDLGHTVLDSLMLTILKGHTSCTPIMADERLKAMTRFPGEEIDICGRWDADSPCLRALNAHGSPRIPFSWKHMFCHTSVQAICHAIIRIFSMNHAPDINTPSGLFTRSCFTCGDTLVPGPIHTLVLTAFRLAQNGCDGENLFGMLACLVCLLVYGADPTAKADLSVNALLGISEQQECTHALLDPLELGEKVPLAALDTWSEEVKLGWECLMALLRFVHPRRAQGPPVPSSSHGGYDNFFDYSEFPSPGNRPLLDDADNSSIGDDDSDMEECLYYKISERYCANSEKLGVLWAAIQTELVSYRRLRDGDPWLSGNFNLAVVRDGANEGAGFSRLPLVDRGMMKPTCACGRFKNGFVISGLVTTDEACSFYFSNMEDWKRSSFCELNDAEDQELLGGE